MHLRQGRLGQRIDGFAGAINWPNGPIDDRPVISINRQLSSADGRWRGRTTINTTFVLFR
jgi:hypothetical protein